VIGGSGYFDGSGDYLTVPNTTNLNLGNTFTIEAWVYSQTTSLMQLVSCRDGSGGPCWQIVLNWNGSPTTGGVAFKFEDGNVPVGTSSDVVKRNAWTHIAVCRNGTSFELFCNGVRVATGTNSTTFPTPSSAVFIGSLNTPITEQLIGYMSDFRMLKGTAEIVKLVDDGAIPMKDLPRWMIGKACYDNLQNKLLQKNWRDVTVKWFWGPKGSGKTSKAMDEIDEMKLEYWISDGKQLDWFDNYDGEPCVVIDELRGDTCKWAYLLRLLDGYRMTVPIKGGFVAFKPTHIYITSFAPPERVFVNHTTDRVWDSLEQLLRRITEIRDFTDDPYECKAVKEKKEREEETKRKEQLELDKEVQQMLGMEEELTQAQREHDEDMLIAHPIPIRLPSLHESLDHMVEDSSLTDLELTPTWESDK